jgi:hypothetical protein
METEFSRGTAPQESAENYFALRTILGMESYSKIRSRHMHQEESALRGFLLTGIDAMAVLLLAGSTALVARGDLGAFSFDALMPTGTLERFARPAT